MQKPYEKPERFYHSLMQNRWNTLSDMSAIAQDIREQQVTDDEKVRRILIKYLLRFSGSDNIDLGQQASWNAMNLEDLKALVIETIRANTSSASFADVYETDLYQELDEIYQYGDPFAEMLFVTFLIAGFIPGVNMFVDFADTVIALGSGDVVGALINVLPFDEILSGARRLRRVAPNAIRTVFDSPNSSQVTRLNRKQADEAVEQVTKKSDELQETLNLNSSNQKKGKLSSTPSSPIIVTNKTSVDFLSKNLDEFESTVSHGKYAKWIDIPDDWDKATLQQFYKYLADNGIPRNGNKVLVPIEVGAVFNSSTSESPFKVMQGTTIFNYDSDKGFTIKLTILLPGGNLEGKIVTHTHPFGSSLSNRDIAFAVQNQVAELRAVSPDATYRWIIPENTREALSELTDDEITEFANIVDRSKYGEKSELPGFAPHGEVPITYKGQTYIFKFEVIQNS